ncbi:MAG: hypothetical protein L6Q35_00470 [Phycisphaerales bacterium]|nr:hypothetical protein [Phycisphaerales bacterium]
MEVTPVDLTKSTSRQVLRVRTRWQADQLIETCMGIGWAHASFDRPRSGSTTITFADGSTEVVSRSSEDEYELPRVGSCMVKTQPILPFRASGQEIPF